MIMESMQRTTRENLWRALLSDPNDFNSLTQWIEDHERHDEDPGAADALRKAATLPGSWLASIWTTRALLAQGQLAAAMAIYREALNTASPKSLVMQEISGHLGEAGYYREAIELLLPRYDPRDHGAFAGFNLFNACEDICDLESARIVLDRMEKGVDHPQFEKIVRIRQEKLELLRERRAWDNRKKRA